MSNPNKPLPVGLSEPIFKDYDPPLVVTRMFSDDCEFKCQHKQRTEEDKPTTSLHEHDDHHTLAGFWNDGGETL